MLHAGCPASHLRAARVAHRVLPNRAASCQHDCRPANARAPLRLTARLPRPLRCSAAADAPKESSSLFRAAYKGRLDELRFLLAAGADVNSRDWDGSTALVAATYAEQLDAVALLLAAGADVAAANDDGDVPLMFAAMRGNAPLIELLLDAGADANSVNKVGGTPLMYAASNGQAAAIPLLMLRGADPGARDAAGRTASDIAATVPPMQEAVRAALRGAQAEE